MAKNRYEEPPVEMLLTRYTWTASGDPMSLADARNHFGVRTQPAQRPGWFWSAATPTSAARIRASGHKAVGTEVTTWIPPQTPALALPVQEPEAAWRATTRPEDVSELTVFVGRLFAGHYSDPAQLDVVVERDDSDEPLIQIKGVRDLEEARAAFLDAWMQLGIATAMSMTTQPDVRF